MTLVVDCCALVHAKAMARLRRAPLVLLGAMPGAAYITTPRVRGELGQSSLEATLGGWERQGLLTLDRATLQEVRTVRNHLRRGDMEPGNHDKELIAVALRREMPLLTHDTAAAALARRVGIVVYDLVDLAGAAADAGLVSIEELDADWGDLAGLPWPWPDYPWEGGLIRTLEARR